MDYSVLIPGRLYAGTKIGQDDWSTIRQLHVNAIVNVSDRPDRFPSDTPPLPVLFFKLSNREKPSLQRLQNAVERTVNWLQQGYVLYIHDLAGINRLGFFLTALYMRLFHLPYEQALQEVRKSRPQVAPRYQFVDLLKEYQSSLGM